MRSGGSLRAGKLYGDAEGVAMRTTLITGANRGLGLALATRYAARPETHVIATARDRATASDLTRLAETHAGIVTILEADVADDASIANVAATIARGGTTIDLLVNNAGTANFDAFGDVAADDAAEMYRVNALGPLLLTQALRGSLAHGATVVNMTSILGSIERADASLALAYSMSKAALNMVTKQLAVALRGDDIAVLSLHPGWVRTRMGGDGATLTVDQSADGMVRVIDGFDLARSGAYLTYDGSPLPW